MVAAAGPAGIGIAPSVISVVSRARDTIGRGGPHTGDGLTPNRRALSEEQLARLLAVGRGLVAELDLEAVLLQVLGTARDLTQARYAALGILDEGKHELERFITLGVDEEERRTIGPPPRGHGVLGELIRTPSPLRLPDVTDHPRSYGFPPGHPPMTTFLGVPVTVRGEAYGNLYLTDKAGGEEFSESDQQLLVVLSEWAAVAIDNARLYASATRRRAELERAVRGLEATSAISRAVGFETELGRVLELIAKRGRAMSDARSFIVLLQSEGVMRVEAVAGEVSNEVVGTEISAESSVPGAVVAAGAPELVADLGARVGHGLDRIAEDARSAVVVPLGFRGRASGALVALDRMRDGHAFDAEDEHLMTSFAASASIAIATAQSVEKDRLRHSLDASEAERARWARELHDETLQELGALKVLLDAARQSDDTGRIRSAMDGALGQIELSIRNLQALITELRPAALDQIGLIPALEALLKRVEATSGIHVRSSIELDAVERRLLPEVERTVYRIVQESLTNAIKHSEAGQIDVHLSADADELSLTIVDDGKGFDQAEISGGFGLVGMQDRAGLVAGHVSVKSALGSGTTVRAQVPLRYGDAAAAGDPSGIDEPPAADRLAG
jgi:two-component system, NarL family, sensor histidine kinase DevS